MLSDCMTAISSNMSSCITYNLQSTKIVKGLNSTLEGPQRTAKMWLLSSINTDWIKEKTGLEIRNSILECINYIFM